MTITGSNITARQAAETFAESAFADRRKVSWITRQSEDGAAQFQLVDGVKTYTVRCLPDYSGWQITDA